MTTQNFEALHEKFPLEPITTQLEYEAAADLFDRLSRKNILTDGEDIYREQLHNLMFEYYIENAAQDGLLNLPGYKQRGL